MAQQPYMGSGLLFPRLLGRAHSWQLVTGQLAALLFHLAGNGADLGEKSNFSYETFLFMP
jgi:hypothetical protein